MKSSATRSASAQPAARAGAGASTGMLGPVRTGSGLIGAALIFLLALGVRAIYLLESARNPTFTLLIMDAADYDRLARMMLEGQRVAHLFWQPVFYPLYLAATYALTDGSIVAAKVGQAVLGGFTAALSYGLGRRLFTPTTGCVAGALTALCGPLIFEEGELLATGWAAFWSVLVVWLLTRYIEVCDARPAQGEPRPPWLCGGTLGLAAALSYLTRPDLAIFLLVSACWLLVRSVRRESAARAAIITLTPAVAAALLLFPVAVWNRVEFGHFGVTPASSGINLFIGNNPDAARTVALRPGPDWNELYECPQKAGVRGGIYAESAWFRARVWDYAAAEPAAFARGLLDKTLQYLSARELPRNVDAYTFGEWSILLRALLWKAGGFGFPFGVVFPLAAVGVLSLLWRARPAAAGALSAGSIPDAEKLAAPRMLPPLLLFLICAPLGSILVFVAARFRVPVLPLLNVLAAAGLVWLCQGVARRMWTRVGVAATVALGALTLSAWPGPFPQERHNYAAELFHLLANKVRNENPIAARDYYAEAVRRDPNDAELHSLLGQLELQLQRPGAAVASLSTAARLDPKAGPVYGNLGSALLAVGRVDEALSAYEEARRLMPQNAEALYNLGVLYVQRNRLEEAAGALQAAVDVRPDNPLALYALGTVLQAQGKMEAASELYLETLRYDPNHAGAKARLRITP